MEVNQLYIQFLLNMLKKEENLQIETYQDEIIVNLYLTLLSLSNIKYSELLDQQEKEIIEDFLKRFNNLKVKIQLKRKPEELQKFKENLITQYYENINVLSIYIKDGKELENIINTMDAKKLTELIDKTTKNKQNKEYATEERNKRRPHIIELITQNDYYIENNIIYIKNEDKYEEISIDEFKDMFSYLLNPDNYNKIYTNNSIERTRELISANIIKYLIIDDKSQEKLDKIIIPMTLTYILTHGLNIDSNINTSKFKIDNIKMIELYSLAKIKENNPNVPKSNNISIPNEYFLNKLKNMIKQGQYYYKNELFVLENLENNISDFRTSIKVADLKEFIIEILDNQLIKTYSKKNTK